MVQKCSLLAGCYIVLYTSFAGAVCTDKEQLNLTYSNRLYKNCSQLASDPDLGSWLCTIFGREGLDCCESCTKIQGNFDVDEFFGRPKECAIESSFELTLSSGEVLGCQHIALYPYTYYCRDYSNYCCENCQNVNTSCVDVPWNITIGRDEKLNCRVLAVKYPVLCSAEYFGNECCLSCRDINTTEGCFMNPLKYWTLPPAQKLFCLQYVSQNPSVCQEQDVMKECCSVCKKLATCTDKMNFDITLDGKRITSCESLASLYPNYCKADFYGGDGNICCSSCKGIDLTCTDSGIYLEPPDGYPVTSCSILAARYPYYCNADWYGGQANKCCASCKDTALSCVDDVTQFWMEEGRLVYCSEAVQLNPLRCFSKACCHSCKKLFQCTDDDFVTISLGGEEINMICSTMAQRYPYFCSLNEYKSDAGKCCISCKDTDTSCVDNPTFTTSYGEKEVSCKTVTANMCQEDEANVTKHCCESCRTKRLNTNRPSTLSLHSLSTKVTPKLVGDQNGTLGEVDQNNSTGVPENVFNSSTLSSRPFNSNESHIFNVASQLQMYGTNVFVVSVLITSISF